MADYNEDFPFEIMGTFDHWAAASAAGWADDQIWSVCVHEDTWTYGPPHHYVNHLHHVVTNEKHDGNTYYNELEEED